MQKTEMNKRKTVVCLIPFILIDICSGNGVLHLFGREGVRRTLDDVCHLI